MDRTVELNIAGLGIILYSPFAVARIRVGDDYLNSEFMKREDIARHVNSCRISAIGTGSPGTYYLRLLTGERPDPLIEAAGAVIQLGLEVQDGQICFRDLYDLLQWAPYCPTEQTAELPSGYYLITVFSSLPASGLLGDGQVIGLFFERTDQPPDLGWQGVPDLSRLLLH
jgi:hypothetical protein